MSMLTGFSAHLCDVVQKLRRRQTPIVTIFLSERSNDVFKSYFVIVDVLVSSGVITYL